MSAASVPAADQRGRILDAALQLMSEKGAGDTSMRALAKACGLNVATLYHYFPSKAALLGSVIAERGYFQDLATDEPPLDADAPLPERLAGLLRWLWERAADEEAPVRLLLGESLRGDPMAAATVAQLLEAMDEALARWLAGGFPDLPGDPAATGRLVRRLIVARLIEHLAVAPVRPTPEEPWADEVVAVLLAR